MASQAQVTANRANATLSTGPADTSRTRFNGLAHGLTSKQTVIRGESQAEYDVFAASFRADLAPVSATECLLADRVIAAAWRLKRFFRVEIAFFNGRIDAIFEANPDTNPDSAFSALFTDPAEMARMRLFMRYQNSVQREYDTAMREFSKTKAERTEQQCAQFENVPAFHKNFEAIGFASQPSQPASPSASVFASSEHKTPRYTGLK